MSRPITRRDRDAEATRRDILAAGRQVFARQPYLEVSSDQICDAAGVATGALQHHFGSKLGLFTVVFEGLLHDAVIRVTQAIARYQDPWDQARVGIVAFLDACTDPHYQYVVLKEGPSAIGWQRWRELDNDHFGDLLQTLIARLSPEGLADHPPAMVAATIRGTLTELSFEIARSRHGAQTYADAVAVVERLLAGFGEPRHGGPSARSLACHQPPRRTRVGVGQLRASAGAYLDRVIKGETVEIVRRGRVVASMQPYDAAAVSGSYGGY